MTTIWVQPITVGKDAQAHLGVIDPDRKDRLPAGQWRAVPDKPYWRQMAKMRDIRLSLEEPAEVAVARVAAAKAASAPTKAKAAAAAVAAPSVAHSE